MVTSRALYSSFLLLLAAERLFELWLSRKHARLAFARGAVEVGQRHFRAMSILHTSFLFSCAAEVWLLGRSFPGALGWTALGAALLAQALRYWAIATLGARWNVRVIVVPGDPPITNGPYRFLRHPNYLAVVIEMLAVPLLHGAWLTAAAFSLGNALLLRVRIRAEESALGPLYQAAFAERPRLLPLGGGHG
jgi:methyltransferase